MFRIGEFSKISQTPITQLRYYDEIGLFQPEQIDKFTGYRYYSAAQLPNLNRILAMKSLGLTLEQIQKLVVDQVSADELRGMLALKKAQVEQELRSQVEKLHHIEARLKQVEKEGVMENDDIIIKELPIQPIYSYMHTYADVRAAVQDRMAMTKLLPKKVGKKKLGYFLAINHEESFSFENAKVEMGFMLNDTIEEPFELSNGRTMKMRTLPRVEMAACVARIGGFESNFNCYGNFGRWLETNNYAIAGNIREIFIKQVPMDRIDELVCEIQIPIQPADPQKFKYLN
ncbi:MAG: MerR family transcriptional regulator [Chloroflexota bacterium]